MSAQDRVVPWRFPVSADQWRVRHPGIGVLAYGSEAEARVAAGTAGEVLPPDAERTPAELVAERDRLREKYVAEHEAHTSAMFERDRLREAVGRVRELADRAAGYDFDLVPKQVYEALDGTDAHPRRAPP